MYMVSALYCDVVAVLQDCMLLAAKEMYLLRRTIVRSTIRERRCCSMDILLICGSSLVFLAAGFYMGQKVKVLEVKETQTIRYIEKDYNDEPAYAPPEEER